MICTSLFIILTIGASYDLQDAIATNITVSKTVDNRVRISSVTFEDGLVCSTPSLATLTYNTEADAFLANPLPFTAKRGYEYLRITDHNCVAMETYLIRNAIGFIIPGVTIMPVIDMIMWYFIYKRCKRSTARQIYTIPTDVDARAAAPRRPFTRAAQPPPNNSVSPRVLSQFAAKRLAEAAIRNKDLCPITLEPLTATRAFVPACGHILRELPPSVSTKCPMCSARVNYTVVSWGSEESPPQTEESPV